MVQLILNGIYLPQSKAYNAYPEQLSQQVDMISGRRVLEQRGEVWKIDYFYDYMGNDLARSVLAQLRSGGALSATFLPVDSDEMITSEFLVESLTTPTFAFARSGVALWHNLSFTLREVRPHD